MVRTAPVPVEQRADGRLTGNPAALTIRDVEKEPEGSARRAVMQLIFWAQWGNLPAVVDAYDSRVSATLGVSKVTGGYDYLRPELLTSQVRITATRDSGSGEFVSVELATPRGAPIQDGFLMRRRDGKWRVAYDTLLERAIEAYTVAREAPGDSTPSASARRSGLLAAQTYRDIYASRILAARVEASR